MKKLLLLMTVALTFGQLSAQKGAWKKVDQESVSHLQRIKNESYSERQQLLQVNVDAVRQLLTNATTKQSGNSGIMVEFPNIDGGLETFQVWENSNFAPELQAQYPEIRSYVGKNSTDGSTIHFSISPAGIQTMVLRPDRSSEFIEPYTKDNSTYVLFDSKTRNNGKLPFTCSTADHALTDEVVNATNPTGRSNNQSYKTMRLALSCTAEYTTFFGGTVAGALGGMNATMTRVNGVLEIDLALHLNIIANNSVLIFTNAATDPYSAASIGTDQANSNNLQGWNLQLQNTLSSPTIGVGNAAYDIGHLFGASGGGGNAGCIGCVCSDDDVSNNMDKNKGSAYTSPSNNAPQGDTFDIDYVIHEMGHQLGANHTFSHNSEGSGVNVEPGSGSTIMAYAGITDYNVQSNSDAYFTYRSILQMQNNLAGKTCPVSVAITNTPPTVSAGADFTVPAGTAYILKGIVSDAEGDNLNYCWEQNNSATNVVTGANSICSGTKVTGPNYRSFMPKTVPDRYMPEYSKVLAGTLSTMWESVNTTVGRSLRFTLTVRDNHVGQWQTNTDEVTVISSAPYNSATGSGVGPFAVTSPIAGAVWGAAGSVQTVTWSVNNTISLPGSDNINIKMSTDGGQTWPITLAANTPNDGTEDIVVPVATSTNCRILIEPTGNVYYAVNSPFAVGYESVNICNTYPYTGAAFAVPDGSSSFTVKSINVPTAGTISDVNIHVNATHPNLQNLTLAVIRPGNGTINTYFSQQCAGSANMDVTFDEQAGAFACASPLTGTMKSTTGVLNALNTFQQQGNWQFGFKDSVAGNAGTIQSFSIEICSQSLVPVPPLATQQFSFSNFALYPNPNNGSFKLQFDAASSKVNVVVHDISGRKIFSSAYAASGLFSEDIQLNNAQAGIYLVSITDGDQKIVKRVVVE